LAHLQVHCYGPLLAIRTQEQEERLSEHEQGQVAAGAAEVYERFFVPALFADWPVKVLATAGVRPGERVLDVACGTGVLARAALRATKGGGASVPGAITGIDANDDMLAVARAKEPSIVWTSARAEALPFDDASFDRVVSQFGLMFFEDRVRAIAEMMRVTRPGGRVAICVWAALADTPGYAKVAEILRDLFDDEVASSIEVPYCLGDLGELRALLDRSGARDAEIATYVGQARFESIDAWVHTDVKGWTLAEVLDDAGYERLKVAARERLAEFVAPDGSVVFDAPAHVIKSER